MKIYLFLIVALISCDMHQKSNHTLTSYHDVDLFNLRGIDSINEKEIQHPYISINTIDKEERLIEYHLSNKIKYIRHYFYREGYWKGEYELKDAGEYYYEYILPGDTIVTFAYEGNPMGSNEFRLLSVEILGRKSIIEYLYDGIVKVLPTNDYKKLINDNVSKVKTTSFYNTNNIFHIEEELKDYELDSIIVTDKSCYNIGMKSFFWWAYFGSPSQIVICD